MRISVITRIEVFTKHRKRGKGYSEVEEDFVSPVRKDERGGTGDTEVGALAFDALIRAHDDHVGEKSWS
jgi:hypothetical protein